MDLRRLFRRTKRGITLYVAYYVQRRMPTIIYSTGHVGSMALLWSLERRGELAFNLHTLNPVRLKADNHPRSWQWAYDHIIRAGRYARIISIARDPLALMISEYFTKLKWIAGRRGAAEALSTDELVAMFVKDYFEQNRHLRILDWYDDEMAPSIGIDIFLFPAAAEQGFVRFTSGHFDVLLLKAELDDATKSRVVGDFVGLPDLTIMRANVAEKRTYAEKYKAFKERLKLPSERLDTVYDSRYARHFYTESERCAMRARWQ